MNKNQNNMFFLKKTILIVEDDEINIEILSNLLDDDYYILSCENGQEALDILKEKKDIISLILLDLIMPVMDGYTFLKIKKDQEDIKDIPVIVITSENSAEVDCLKMGAVDFIPKIVNEVDVIKARIKRLIELHEKTIIIQKTSDDELTSLYNQEFFRIYADQLLHSNDLMDLISINLLNFENYTEIIGKVLSEELLKTTAEVLKSIASLNNGIAGRGNIDEFYLLIEHQDSYDFIIEDINKEIARKFPALHTKARLGIYPNVDKNIDIDILCKRALQCVHVINKLENVDYKFFDESLNNLTNYRQRLVNDFDEALRTEQFVIFFQPKFSIQGNEPVIAGAEALIRWIHPELGFISPGDFIPLFEENGLITKLDLFVCDRTCRHIVEFKKHGLKVPPISINLSRVDFYLENLSSVIYETVKKYNLTSSEINLEVTESAYINETNTLIRKVEELRQLGFKFEIDDFGSGYSSVYTVAAMPFDILKLDMIFMRDFDKNEKIKPVISSMIKMMKMLKEKVVAEGVETKEQYEYLKNHDCDYVQGYYLSKPVSADVFLNLLKEGK